MFLKDKKWSNVFFKLNDDIEKLAMPEAKYKLIKLKTKLGKFKTSNGKELEVALDMTYNSNDYNELIKYFHNSGLKWGYDYAFITVEKTSKWKKYMEIKSIVDYLNSFPGI